MFEQVRRAISLGLLLGLPFIGVIVLLTYDGK
jgi:hypothetical protein